MDKKIIRRGKAKKQTESHGRTGVKKRLPEVTKEKEEQERLEAANILSSLKFMAPSSSDANTEESESSNVANKTSRGVTYLQNSTTGISTIGAPSVVMTKGGQIESSGTVTAILKPAVVAQLAQMSSNTRTISKELYTQLLTLQALNAAKSQPVPNIIKTSETSTLPTTLNPIKTVNRSVATALRHVVAQNTKINPNNEVIKSIKEKIQKKNPDNELNNEDAANKASLNNSDKTESTDIKKETTETSLPLKKRRLVSLLGTQSSNTASNALSDLSTAVQMENILNLARDYPDHIADQRPSEQSLTQRAALQGNSQSTFLQSEGYKPVSCDPRTSLLVLSDLKTALTPDEDGDLPIHIAVVHENTTLVKKFIDIMAMSGKSVDRYNKLQQTPLHLAVLVDKPDIVQALLQANADPNLVDRNGCTSCHIAVTKQFRDCLKQIFTDSRKRVEVNTRNYEGYSPLHTSVELGDLKSMKFLNERGAPTYLNLNIQDGKAGRSVLFYATEYKRLKMVEYLVSCGANVDLQNYAGVSALMTSQAGGFDDITHILTRALENQKGIEDAIVAKNVPIAPMPNKLKLSIPESPAVRSRSVSSTFEGKVGSRRSSTSSTSPMDLSVQRKIRSPANGPGRRSKQNSIDSEMEEKLLTPDIERISSKKIKEKHTQLVAALEDRNYLTPSQQGYAEGFLSFLQFYEKAERNRAGSKLKKLSAEKDGSDKTPEIKEEPMDTDEQDNRVRNQLVASKLVYSEMETTTNENVQESLSYGDTSKNSVMDTGGKLAPGAHHIGDSTEDTSDNTMEVQEPPSLAVSSHGVSHAEKANNSVTLIESPEESNTSPSSKESVMLTELKENNHSGVEVLPSSQGSSQGFEVRNSQTTDDSSTDNDKIQTKLTTVQDLSCDEALVDKTDCDSEMDINAIEMDAEDDVERSLVIDENIAAENSVVADKATIIEHNDEDSVMLDSASIDNDNDSNGTTDNVTNSVTLETTPFCNESNRNTDTTINSYSMENKSDSSKLENVKNSCDIDKVFSTGIQNSKQLNISLSSIQTEKVTEQYSETLEPKNVISDTNKFLQRQSSLPMESSQTFKSFTNSLNEKILSKINKDKEIRQAGLGSLNLEKLKPVDKTKSDTALTTGQTKTLYIREGENYKPIKIFVDGSPQSSLLLQRMLGQAQGVSNMNTGNFSFVKSDASVNKADVDTSKVNMKASTNLLSQPASLTDEMNKINTGKVMSSNETQSVNTGLTSEHSLKENIQDNVVTDSGDSNAVVNVQKSAQVDTLGQELGSRMTFQGDKTNQVKVPASKVIQEPIIQSSTSLPSRVTDSVSKTTTQNTDKSLRKSVESVPDDGSDKLPSDHSSATLSEGNLTHSTIKTSVSQKPQTSGPKSTGSVKTGSGPTVTSQSKVANLIQNRNAVSTSEGTLTWVNPDIKSRLSKALSSPQRKLGTKVSSQEGETSLSNHQNVQVVGINSS